MCRHVRINATEDELKQQGIKCPVVMTLLLSGRAFAVEKVKHDGERPRIFLADPFSETQNVWVYEEFTQTVGGSTKEF